MTRVRSTTVFEDLYVKSKLKKTALEGKQEQSKVDKIAKELTECTFRPQIHTNRSLSTSRSQIYER
jgi:hypothetical protein